MVAEELGGYRVGQLGQEDVINDRFVIECKLRAKMIFLSWWEQAKKHTLKKANKDKIALAVVKQKNAKRSFVIIEMEDFKKLIGVKQNAVQE